MFLLGLRNTMFLYYALIQLIISVISNSYHVNDSLLYRALYRYLFWYDYNIPT